MRLWGTSTPDATSREGAFRASWVALGEVGDEAVGGPIRARVRIINYSKSARFFEVSQVVETLLARAACQARL